jgi:hypothetical protein
MEEQAEYKVKNNNMHIWKNVCQTDPSNTKTVNFGYKFTAIDAYSQIKIATELWGPFGMRWGVKDEEFVMLTPDLIIYTAILFYEDGTIPIHSSAKTSDSKGRIDDDCVKKAATDALTKGLSKVGFNADVFLGLFDDSKYVQNMKKSLVRILTNRCRNGHYRKSSPLLMQ